VIAFAAPPTLQLGESGRIVLAVEGTLRLAAGRIISLRRRMRVCTVD
jgi:hypothetical protein